MRNGAIANAEFGMRNGAIANAECGMRNGAIANAECGMRNGAIANAEFGMRSDAIANAGFGMRNSANASAECGVRKAEFNITNENKKAVIRLPFEFYYLTLFKKASTSPSLGIELDAPFLETVSVPVALP